MTSICDREPAELPETVPSSLKHIVYRCLAKDPKQRFQSAADLAFALRASTASASAATTALPVQRVRRRAWIPWAVAAVLAGGLAASLVVRPKAVAPEAMTLEVSLPPDTRLASPWSFAISPDGRHLAFSAVDAKGKVLLWVRNLGTGEARAMAGTEGALEPFCSPDSRFIGFYAFGSLHRVDLNGGKQPIATVAGISRGSWSEDGAIVISANNLLTVPASGGEAKVLYSPDEKMKELSFGDVTFLPGGKTFVFHVFGDRGGTMLGSLDGRERRFLFEQTDSPSRYAPATSGDGGFLIYIKQGRLLAHAFDPTSGTTNGEPVQIAAGMGSGPVYSASRNGVLVLRKDTAGDRQLTWYDRSGKPIGKLGEPGRWSGFRISPDGGRLAVSRREDDRNYRLHLVALDKGVMQRFTFGPGFETVPIWHPSGREILFYRFDAGKRILLSKDSSGAGGEKVLMQGANRRFPTPQSVSPDGRWLIAGTFENGSDISLVPLTGEPKPIPFLNSSSNEFGGMMSPDGRWIAYTSNETGSNQVFIQPVPEAMGGPKDRGKWQISSDGGNGARWRKDGKELYYAQPDGKIMAVEIAANATAVQAGPPKVLFSTLGSTPVYEVTPDGQRFLVAEPEKNSEPPFTVLLNWQAGLKK